MPGDPRGHPAGQRGFQKPCSSLGWDDRHCPPSHLPTLLTPLIHPPTQYTATQHLAEPGIEWSLYAVFLCLLKAWWKGKSFLRSVGVALVHKHQTTH